MRPRDPAELARSALLWLAGRPDDLGRLLAESGLGPADLRARADDPVLLGFVLDFVLADEARLRAFAEAEGVAPDAPLRARAALPGGDAPHWT